MKKCPYCAEEIQDEAIVCRYCGRDLQAPGVPKPTIAPAQPVKQPAKKQIGLLAGAGIVIVICCALLFARAIATANPRVTATATKVSQGADSVVITIPTSTAGPSPTPAPTIAPTQELGKTRDNPFPRNSVVDIGSDMQVMITNVQRPANDIVAQGNMFNATPIPNVQEYMIVKLHVECKKATNEKCNFNNYEFKTVGKDGQVHDRASVAGIPQSFESFAEFFGGASLDGNIAFLVTQSDASIVLFHEPLFFGDPVYISLQQ